MKSVWLPLKHSQSMLQNGLILLVLLKAQPIFASDYDTG
jgi:hypothetical protein